MKTKRTSGLIALMMLSLAFCVVVIPAQAATAVPKISSITPSQTTAGTFDLTIYGSNFNPWTTIDQIYWIDSSGNEHFMGNGKVLSRTPIKLVVREYMTGANSGTYIVKVKNSFLGQLSNGKPFKINLKLSENGIIFLKQKEGNWMKNGLHILYEDSKGHCTIGYGHLVHYGRIDGSASEKPYKNGLTEAQATDLFKTDVAKYEGYVNSYVKVPLTQYQFDALVSWTYNLGPTNLKNSDMLTKLNNGNYAAVPDEMMRYLNPPEIKNRRTAEANLFKTGNYGI